MRIIVGIGNPGTKYEHNRHNVGFQFLEYFANNKNLIFKFSKLGYLYSESVFSGKPFVLIKPDTFINLSGLAVLNIVKYYSLNLSDLLVVCDDINIGTGDIRIRKSGGDGGHNGLASIIYSLESNQFPRMRIGIGSEFNKGFLHDYVLSDFDPSESKKINDAFDRGIRLIENFISEGYSQMLNLFSQLKSSDKKNDSE